MFTVEFSDDADSDSYTLVYRSDTVSASWRPENSNIDDFDVEAQSGSFSYNTGNGSCELKWDAATSRVTMSASRHGDGEGGDLNLCIVGHTIVESLRSALRIIIQHQQK